MSGVLGAIPSVVGAVSGAFNLGKSVLGGIKSVFSSRQQQRPQQQQQQQQQPSLVQNANNIYDAGRSMMGQAQNFYQQGAQTVRGVSGSFGQVRDSFSRGDYAGGLNQVAGGINQFTQNVRGMANTGAGMVNTGMGAYNSGRAAAGQLYDAGRSMFQGGMGGMGGMQQQEARQEEPRRPRIETLPSGVRVRRMGNR